MFAQNDLSLLVLAIVQGVTEWLPVSSEGLSVLVMVNFLKMSFYQAFNYAVFLHVGTMLSVLVKFRNDVLGILKLRSSIFKQVLLATVFTPLSAIPLMLLIKNVDVTAANALVGVLLILTGLVLRIPENGYKRGENLSSIESALLGIIQGFAILPGISRSGVTISYLLLRKIKEEEALRLSFIISVPAVAGASVISGIPSNFSFSSALMVTSVTFLVGYAMIDLLIRLAKRVSFSGFCVILGSVAVSLTLLTM